MPEAGCLFIDHLLILKTILNIKLLPSRFFFTLIVALLLESKGRWGELHVVQVIGITHVHSWAF